MHSINLTSDSYSVECKTGLSSITFNETSPIEEKKQKDKKKRVNRKIVCLYCDSVDIKILYAEVYSTNCYFTLSFCYYIAILLYQHYQIYISRIKNFVCA